ncbi:fructosamine kinase family protein [Fructilactobacillus fructivorans]|uniref:fructosamine kinase family protein n=1 Tax=Fructilactobacillus fructivorans TaxID=1614 RepID=UPI00070BEF7D|nr:fructosamine kinase family protein [Fructilactobacillus fructivorans]KRN40263.1 hypothetical protein IV51_GL000445 [Fructilactobacillus fructivorans]
MKKLDQEWINQLPLKNVQSLSPVSGGDINDSYQVKTPDHVYFMKVQPGRGKQFFDHEVEGIHLLSQAANVPTVVSSGEINGDGFLILDWIDVGSGNQYDLGKMVANVHKVHNDQFGLDHNFDAGKIPKNNHWQDTWQKFYVEQRIDPLVKIAAKKGRWNDSRDQHYQVMRQQIIDYYTKHPVTPSLLHGDLWSGNAIFTSKHEPMLIDPDVYFGDREYDLGVTTVFGGFDRDFYRGYNDTYPIEPGFKNRVGWYQFYYALVHVVLFGETFGPLLDGILSSFN